MRVFPHGIAAVVGMACLLYVVEILYILDRLPTLERTAHAFDGPTSSGWDEGERGATGEEDLIQSLKKKSRRSGSRAEASDLSGRSGDLRPGWAEDAPPPPRPGRMRASDGADVPGPLSSGVGRQAASSAGRQSASDAAEEDLLGQRMSEFAKRQQAAATGERDEAADRTGRTRSEGRVQAGRQQQQPGQQQQQQQQQRGAWETDEEGEAADERQGRPAGVSPQRSGRGEGRPQQAARGGRPQAGEEQRGGGPRGGELAADARGTLRRDSAPALERPPAPASQRAAAAPGAPQDRRRWEEGGEGDGPAPPTEAERGRMEQEARRAFDAEQQKLDRGAGGGSAKGGGPGFGGGLWGKGGQQAGQPAAQQRSQLGRQAVPDPPAAGPFGAPPQHPPQGRPGPQRAAGGGGFGGGEQGRAQRPPGEPGEAGNEAGGEAGPRARQQAGPGAAGGQQRAGIFGGGDGRGQRSAGEGGRLPPAPPAPARPQQLPPPGQPKGGPAGGVQQAQPGRAAQQAQPGRAEPQRPQPAGAAPVVAGSDGAGQAGSAQGRASGEGAAGRAAGKEAGGAAAQQLALLPAELGVPGPLRAVRLLAGPPEGFEGAVAETLRVSYPPFVISSPRFADASDERFFRKWGMSAPLRAANARCPPALDLCALLAPDGGDASPAGLPIPPAARGPGANVPPAGPPERFVFHDPQFTTGGAFVITNGRLMLPLDCGWGADFRECVRKAEGRSDPLADPRLPRQRFKRLLYAMPPQGWAFQHWLDGALPKLTMVAELLRQKDVHVLADAINIGGSVITKVHPIVTELWRALGVTEDRLVHANNQVVYEAEELIFACNAPPYHPHQFLAGQAMLGVLPRPAAPPRRKIIYVSRNKGGAGNAGRRVLNEEALVKGLGAWVRARGLREEVVVYAHHQFPTLESNLRLFADAAAIVGPHGGGMYNEMFAPAGALVVEFFPVNRVTGETPQKDGQMIWVMAELLRHNYWMMATGVNEAMDMTVDLQKLLRILDSQLPAK